MRIRLIGFGIGLSLIIGPGCVTKNIPPPTSSAAPSSEKQYLKEKLDRIIQARQAASASIEEFDHELTLAEKNERPFSIRLSPSYLNLSALKILLANEESEFALLYQHLKKSQFTSINSAKILGFLRTEFNQVASTRSQAALTPLMEQMLDPTDDSDNSLLRQYLARQAPDPSKSPSHHLILNNLNVIKNSLQKQGLGMPPAKFEIKPSVNANGYVTGDEFPAGTWALTFDDGPHPKFTPATLEVLREFEVPATFFVLTKMVLRHEMTFQDLIASQYPIMNHSYSHANLTAKNTDLRREIVASTQIIEKLVGVHPRFFRCPFGIGIKTRAIRKMIADAGMINVLWNVDSLDWHDRNAARIAARVRREMKLAQGGIILFHNNHRQSIDAARLLLQEEKIRWIDLSGAVDELNAKSCRP